MALIPDLSSIPDLAPVADGEYDFRIITAKENPSKKTGRNSLMLVCEFIDEDNASNLIHSLWLPMETDDKAKADVMWRMIKDFVKALGLDTDTELEADEFINIEFSAQVVLDENDEYGNRNVIKRIT